MRVMKEHKGVNEAWAKAFVEFRLQVWGESKACGGGVEVQLGGMNNRLQLGDGLQD